LKSNLNGDIVSILRGLRQRMFIRRLLDASAFALLTAAAGLVVLGAVLRIAGRYPAFTASWAVVATVGAIFAAFVFALARRPGLGEVAGIVDRLGGTKDRLTTALALSRESSPRTPLAPLAQRECGEFIARTDFRPLISLRFPRNAAWLTVPVLALVLLQWDALRHRDQALSEANQAQSAVVGTVQQIEKLAEQVRKANEQTPNEDLKKLAEQLRQSAARLRVETNKDAAEKAALREVSALEEMMRELQKQPAPLEEIKELAKAMANLPGMQDVLNALNEENLAEAQRALDRALAEQKEQAVNPMEQEQAEKAIREAMQGLSDRRRLSQALQQLAEQMKQQGGGSQQLSQQAMQKLAQMLQQTQQQKGSQSDGKGGQQSRQMTLQELIAALENMKAGDGQSQANQGSNEQTPGGGQQVMIQSFGSSHPQGQPQFGDANQPSGRPGSERDFGTTNTPFGEASDPQERGGELALRGQMSEGETLSMMLPSAGDSSKSARRYKELYEAMASAAQDAVEQEHIPLGSRFLVKRYFESIRPKE
jgi:hypothetical protein